VATGFADLLNLLRAQHAEETVDAEISATTSSYPVLWNNSSWWRRAIKAASPEHRLRPLGEQRHAQDSVGWRRV